MPHFFVKTLSVLSLAILATLFGNVEAAQQAQDARRAVVWVQMSDGTRGSGVCCWADGDRAWYLTNAHVAEPLQGPGDYIVQNGSRHQVLRSQEKPEYDLAILTCRNPDAEWLPLSGDHSGELRKLGFPLGMERLNERVCRVVGWARASRMSIDSAELDAGSYPGESGGPVLNSDGHIVGLLWGSNWERYPDGSVDEGSETSATMAVYWMEEVGEKIGAQWGPGGGCGPQPRLQPQYLHPARPQPRIQPPQAIPSQPVTPAPDPAPQRTIDGLSIEGTDLVVRWSDGTEQNLGRVVGQDGEDGTDGTSPQLDLDQLSQQVVGRLPPVVFDFQRYRDGRLVTSRSQAVPLGGVLKIPPAVVVVDGSDGATLQGPALGDPISLGTRQGIRVKGRRKR